MVTRAGWRVQSHIFTAQEVVTMTMNTRRRPLPSWTAAALIVGLQCVLAAKDANYYANGRYNSNVDQKMYWRDSFNVIADLSSFDALYVTYHNCAWSTYTGEDGADNACGFEGNDEEYWYMQYGECNRANVAYSLYGVLKGEKDVGCQKNTFINSFFTTGGVEVYLAAMENAGVTFSTYKSYNNYGNNNNGEQNDEGDNDDGGGNAGSSGVTSDCTVRQYNGNNNGDGGEDGDNANNNGDSYAHGTTLNTDYRSFGLGCSPNNMFAQKKYHGSYCAESDASTVSDKMATFNKELAKARCIQIYSATSNDNGGDDGANNDNGDAPDLLTYSRACTLRENPGQCPDPHGKVAAYSNALSTFSQANSSARELVKSIFTWILLVVGVMLLVLSLLIYRRKLRRAQVKASAKKKRASSHGPFRRMAQRFRRTHSSDKLGLNKSRSFNSARKTESERSLNTST